MRTLHLFTLLLGSAIPLAAQIAVRDNALFPYLDDLRKVAARVEASCGARRRPALLSEARAMADSLTKFDGTTAAWYGLGCDRALLFIDSVARRHSPLLQRADEQLLTGSIWAFENALRVRPGNAGAAEALAAIAPSVTDARRVTVPLAQLQPLSDAFYQAVRAGVTSPAVLRACASSAFGLRDLATGRHCIARGLASGRDSSWYLTRSAWLNSLRDDSENMLLLFDRAVALARDSESIGEMLGHAAHLVRANLIADSTRAVWFRIGEGGRADWLHTSATSFANEKSGGAGPMPLQGPVDFATLLGESFARRSMRGPNFLTCTPVMVTASPNRGCGASGPVSGAVLDLAAQSYQLWDPVTFAPIALITWAVRRDGLEASGPFGKRSYPIELNFRELTWDDQHWTDTTVRRDTTLDARSPLPSHFAGYLTVPPTNGNASWTLTLTQPGNAARGIMPVDGRQPRDPDSFGLSDLLIGAKSQGLEWELGGRKIALAPLGVLSGRVPVQMYYQGLERKKPAEIYFQVLTEKPRPDSRISIVLYRMQNDRALAPAALAIRFSRPLTRQLSEIQQDLDLSRLASGDYLIEVRVDDASHREVVRRSMRVVLR